MRVADIAICFKNVNFHTGRQTFATMLLTLGCRHNTDGAA